MHHQILTAPLSLNSPCKTFSSPLSTEVAQSTPKKKKKPANFVHKTYFFVTARLWEVCGEFICSYYFYLECIYSLHRPFIAWSPAPLLWQCKHCWLIWIPTKWRLAVDRRWQMIISKIILFWYASASRQEFSISFQIAAYKQVPESPYQEVARPQNRHTSTAVNCSHSPTPFYIWSYKRRGLACLDFKGSLLSCPR